MFEDETQRLLSNSLRHQRQSFLVLRQSECSDFEYEFNWQVVHGQRGFNLFLAHCKAEVLIGSRHFPIHPVLCHGRHSHQEPSTSSPKKSSNKNAFKARWRLSECVQCEFFASPTWSAIWFGSSFSHSFLGQFTATPSNVQVRFASSKGSASSTVDVSYRLKIST